MGISQYWTILMNFTHRSLRDTYDARCVCVCVRGNCLAPMIIDRRVNEHVRRLLTADKRRDWHVFTCQSLSDQTGYDCHRTVILSLPFGKCMMMHACAAFPGLCLYINRDARQPWQPIDMYLCWFPREWSNNSLTFALYIVLCVHTVAASA